MTKNITWCKYCQEMHETDEGSAESALMNLLCTHEEINFLAKGIAQIARYQTNDHQYIAWEPIAIELHKYAICRKT